MTANNKAKQTVDDAEEQFAALHVAHHEIVDIISDISIARYTQDQFRAIVALINATAMDEFWKKQKEASDE